MNSFELCKKGMMSVGEVKLLKEVCAMLPDDPVVAVIGAGVGTSTLAILEERPGAIVFSFDVNIESFKNERKVLIDASVSISSVIRVIGRSWNMGSRIPVNFDLVFVDGAHHDQAVLKDIASFLPKVKSGGYMFFHDYDHPNLPGLTKIVDDQMSDQKRIGKSRYLIAYEICAD